MPNAMTSSLPVDAQQTQRLIPIAQGTIRARALRLSREQLLRLIMIGEIAGDQRGRLWFVDRNDLDRYIRERTEANVPTTSPAA